MGISRKGFWSLSVERRGAVLPSFDIKVNSGAENELELCAWDIPKRGLESLSVQRRRALKPSLNVLK